MSLEPIDIEARLEAHQLVLHGIMLATKTKPILEMLLKGLDDAEAAELTQDDPEERSDGLMHVAYLRNELHRIVAGG